MSVEMLSGKASCIPTTTECTPVGFVASQRSLNPADLRVIELIDRSIVERNEIYPSLNPVIISSEPMIAGIVAKSLGANRW
jgi:hypothetical protein